MADEKPTTEIRAASIPSQEVPNIVDPRLICAADAEERAFVLGAMMSVSMAFQTWIPLVVLKTVDAPKFFAGYTSQAVMQPVAFAGVVLLWCFDKEGRRNWIRVSNEASGDKENEDREATERDINRAGTGKARAIFAQTSEEMDCGMR